MFKPYAPNEKIIDRAVELWKRELSAPKFDNGADNLASMLAGALATKLAENNKATPEKLEAFGQHLKYILMNELSIETITGEPEKENSYKSIHNSLHVDYGPDYVLAAAAKHANLSLNLFPWKTDMSIHEEYVAFGVGYCVPHKYHYPLKDGRWLITELVGNDISKVIEYAEGGKPVFDIEGGTTKEQWVQALHTDFYNDFGQGGKMHPAKREAVEAIAERSLGFEPALPVPSVPFIQEE